MLKEKEIEQIKSLLEESTNPIFLFDDDGDGLCSYLMLKSFYKKGIGTPIKTPGPLNTFYLDKIENEKADLVVILDKAVVMQEFIDSCPCKVLYIDHHPILKLKRVYYFNSLKNDKKSYIPTSYMIYKTVKSDLWIATIGCLFDYKVPDFIKEFKKSYPDLITKITKDAGYYKYKGEIGKLIKIFNFNLKGKSEEVKRSVKAFENISSPYEILNKTTDEGKYVYERYEKLNKDYEWLLQEAEKEATTENMIIFICPPTRVSFVSDLATELSYNHQDKTIVIAREKEIEMKLSIRNQKKNVKRALAKSLEDLEGYGGGHEHAVGATIKRKDFNIFIERLKNSVK